jgi:hypothetical protein
MEERGDANMDSLSSAQTLLLPTNGERCDEKKCCLLPFASYLLALAEPAMNQRGGGSWTKANERNLHKFCYDKIIYIYTQYFYIEPGYWSCTGTKPPSQTTLGPHQAHPTNRVEPHRLIQKSRIFPWPYPPWPPWPNTFHLFPFIS